MTILFDYLRCGGERFVARERLFSIS